MSRAGGERGDPGRRPPAVRPHGLPADSPAWRYAVDRLGEAVVVTPAGGGPAYMNRAARELCAELGRPVADGTGSLERRTAVAEVEAPDRLPTELTRLTGRPSSRVDVPVHDTEGRRRHLEVTTRPLSDDGPPYGVVSSYRLAPPGHRAFAPLSGHGATAEAGGPAAEATSALRHARELFSTAFRQAPIGMALIDPRGRWLLVNQSLCDLVGYSEPELLDLKFHDVTHPDDLPGQLALMDEVLSGRRSGYQLDKRYLHADGHVIWVSISVSLVRDDEGEPLHLVTQVLDITERHEMEQRLQHLADHDPLTGLLNRRRFEEELIRQIDRCRRYDEHATLVMIDLDRFKEVNDAFGHAAGDETLQSIAAALLGKIRSSDIIARVGGDEFAAILVGVGATQAATATAGIAVTVRELDGLPVPVTASVGATVLLSDDQPDAALLRADEALYRVKAGGRDGASVSARRTTPSVP